MWEPRRLTTLWVSTACYRESFTFVRSSFLNTIALHYQHKKYNVNNEDIRPCYTEERKTFLAELYSIFKDSAVILATFL
jgi:hypothetical protein